ncbi:tRNA (guanosine(46)-N7)-methyltransferase TrmB [Bifidobacterium gallicum]|uniref:tRNA (guanine-N(7)-)-methyltransferase n=1 Tax=Bifidobacterium gallicum DSM 20093 = LMG 11596 TaxID=561180 RepID=D1NV36_9BIFI|nr:tRNA (guanosine(46)-N7)-methyltransferase TrmB [Bifidobacterium gallicum]EFA22687.1 tRNA (guanine-N(7)-)-methyltransferase [Bifidobacterium gallicum DSM 20093 = LMG 11596]KFI59641.1 tRNA (guanine-N(7)-)-methyltransferase [Bifidobacterium gallicum DSM 20093 = LMG 11596]
MQEQKNTAEPVAAADTQTTLVPSTPQTQAEQQASNPLHGRKVLSFVRRSARLDDRLQRAWDRYAERYLLDVTAGEGSLAAAETLRIDQAFIREHYGNDASLTVEIGTGQGENIVAAAAAHPERNFLAVEVYDPGVAHTMLLAGKQDLANLRIAQINAPELLAASALGVLDEVWTFFPDPWPKMRHHKRRIVQPELAAHVHAALREGGVWRIATDIEDYALHVHEVMDGRDDFDNVGELTVSLPTEHVGKGNAEEAAALPHADFMESPRFDGRVLTNFERKGLDAGRVIHDFTYRRA